jgi:uncharacterized membrane protein
VSALIAVTYPDEHRAAEVLAALHRLLAAAATVVEDAAVVSRPLDGRITLHQRQDLAGGAAPHGALWEALVALLVHVPDPPPPAAGDPDEALRRLEALGVPETFAVRLCARLPPASSAIWLVVEDASLAGTQELVRPFGGGVLHTTLAA